MANNKYQGVLEKALTPAVFAITIRRIIYIMYSLVHVAMWLGRVVCYFNVKL